MMLLPEHAAQNGHCIQGRVLGFLQVLPPHHLLHFKAANCPKVLCADMDAFFG
jgi:hypothetical protein